MGYLDKIRGGPMQSGAAGEFREEPLQLVVIHVLEDWGLFRAAKLGIFEKALWLQNVFTVMPSGGIINPDRESNRGEGGSRGKNFDVGDSVLRLLYNLNLGFNFHETQRWICQSKEELQELPSRADHSSQCFHQS